ncbi:MAG: hypothetical protein Q4B22_09600 [Eubacteriales bacterium]|nr:hypothetical protein [Eubacteriales bacterium]
MREEKTIIAENSSPETQGSLENVQTSASDMEDVKEMISGEETVETEPENTESAGSAEGEPLEAEPEGGSSEEKTDSEVRETETDSEPSEMTAGNETEEENTEDEIPEKEAESEAGEPEAEGEASEDAPEENSSKVKSGKVRPYHERYYLRYGEGKRTAPLDLKGTKAFLTEIGFDGGELRQARSGGNISRVFQTIEPGSQMRCSYCGTEISGVEFYRLPDGRLRCTNCSSTLIRNKAEIEEIFRRILNNLDSFFGATIDVPISIEVTDERKLKRKIGEPIGTRDSQSILILGVAINKKGKYSIILENGAPRISLIATFAHELTHIWQYIHWDTQKGFRPCAQSKRLLIYEGLAKWVEIQYLYLIGETNAARREELITRNRQDEYGIGFRLYEDQYPLSRKAMTCEETPFTTDRYPLG